MAELFLRVMNMSVSAGWLILAVIVFRLVFKKTPKWVSCILWGMAALRLVIPVSVESVLSLIPSTDTFPVEMVQTGTPQIHTGIEYLNSTVNPLLHENFASAPVHSANTMQMVTAVCGQIWLLGIAVMLLYAVVSYIAVCVRVRESVREGDVWMCDRVDAPFILGVLFPRIIVPSALAESDREYVVAHERAHVSRFDHIWKPLGFALLSVYWFNPLVWIGYVLLCRDIEAACDEKVIKKMGEKAKIPYANALINCSVKKRYIAACPLAFGETDVKSRIRGVLHYKKPTLWVIIFSLIVCSAVAVLFLTDPKNDKTAALGAQKGGSDFSGVTLRITAIETKAPDPYITVKWINKSMTGIEFGSEFLISKYEDGVWEDRRLDGELQWDDDRDFVKSGDASEITYKLNGMIMTDTGKYRFEAKFSLDGEPNSVYTAYAEFELKRQVQGISVHTLVPVTLVYDAPWYSFVQYPENAPHYMIANDMELLEVRDEAVPLGKLRDYDITKKSFADLFADNGWFVGEALSFVREDNERAWSLETEDGRLVVLLLQKDGTYLIGLGNTGVGEMKAQIRWLYELMQKEGQTVRQTAYDNSVYYYSESCSEESIPNVSEYYLMTEDEAEKLYSMLKERRWQDDALVDRLEFVYDGKVRIDGQWLYFGYEQEVFYYGGYFCEGADDAVKYLKKLSKSAEPHYPIDEVEDTVDEKKGVVYAFDGSPEFMSPTIILYPDEGRFQFTYSIFSSELNIGTYEIKDGILILKTDDGSRVYTFREDGGEYVFDAERSSKIPSYKYGEGKAPQCPVPDGAKFVSKTSLMSSLDDWISKIPVITSVKHDINSDGSPEECTLYPGPTSGVNSLVIRVVDKKSGKEYRDWWNCDLENTSFSVEGEKLYICGEMRLSMVDYVCEYEMVSMSVTLENGELIIEKSENDSRIGGFLRLYNFEGKKAGLTQDEINAVCKNMYEKLGRTDPDTGFDYYCVVDSYFEIKGEKYYFVDWKWIVEDDEGNSSHASQITQFAVSEDFSKLYDAYFEDEGVLKIYNKRNIIK